MQPADNRHCASLFLIFLRLGLTSFGGPAAHLAYLHAEFVVRRRWLNDRDYAELVALCQLLPGPASSQVGMALGLARAGYRGALAAWAGFTLPSALIMTALGLGMAGQGALPGGLLHGLKIAAVAVVAQALIVMTRQHCNGWRRLALMLASCGWTLLLPYAWAQPALIACAALAGQRLFKSDTPAQVKTPPRRLGARFAALRLATFWLATFCVLLVGLPILADFYPNAWITQADVFYRVGSLVFGGGHVVLPLLHNELVPTGLIAPDTFVAGYGAAQALPGPLFTFAAFLGASMNGMGSGGMLQGMTGAVTALCAIFLPGFLLVAAVLPFWDKLRRHPNVQAALTGVNAAVVGLLLAALYQPVWTSAVHGWQDAVFALLAWAALSAWKRPAWQVVLGSALAGWLTG
jgi:chromate transporter